jgi:predicted Zn finger-like uncharacterized protein
MTDAFIDPQGHQITVCPDCSTAFRVTEADLKVAAGQVRCGVCLTLFDGVKALATTSPVDFSHHKEALQALDHMILEVVGDDRGVQSPEPLEAPAAASSEQEAAQQIEETIPAALEASASVVPEPLPEPPSSEADGQVSEADSQIPEADGQVSEADSQPAESGNQQAAVESDVPDLNAAPVPPVPAVPRAEQAPSAAAPAVSESARPHRAPPSPAGQSVAPASLRGVSLRPPRGLWLGFMLVPLGLLLVASIAIWLQFDTLARGDFRPVLERICAVVGCTLPEQRALDRIKVESLKLGPASDQPGKLRVRLRLVNTAPFEQRFPMLELRFATVTGNLVAGHRFLPADYLRGDAAELTVMPIDTPIQIEQLIPEPGSYARNYTLELH